MFNTKSPKNFKQRKFMNRTSFEFGDETMKYSIKDSGGGRSIEVDYAAIQTEEQQRVEEQNAWFRNAGLFWIVLGIIHVIVRYQMEGTLKGSIWLLIGGLCVLLFSYAKTIYTVIPWEHGQIYIIKNRDHDQILDMIRAFRKKRLLSLCGDIVSSPVK